MSTATACGVFVLPLDWNDFSIKFHFDPDHVASLCGPFQSDIVDPHFFFVIFAAVLSVASCT